MKNCYICNNTSSNTIIYYVKDLNNYLCNKHYLRYKRYGSLEKRSRRDKNEIYLKESYAEIALYKNINGI